MHVLKQTKHRSARQTCRLIFHSMASFYCNEAEIMIVGMITNFIQQKMDECYLVSSIGEEVT